MVTNNSLLGKTKLPLFQILLIKDFKISDSKPLKTFDSNLASKDFPPLL
jgi:hypothetical protein